MQKKLHFLIMTVLLLCTPLPLFSAQAQSFISDGNTIFLPAVLKTDPVSLTVIQQIAQAVVSGRITAEQGLIYQVFAIFGDPRLPAEFSGGSVGEDGDGVLMDAAARWDSLSESAKSTLRPFLIAPNQPGTWFNPTPDAGSTRPGGVPADGTSPSAYWSSISSASHPVRFYWPTGSAPGQAMAVGLRAAMDQKIWNNLTTNMGGKTPLLSTNGTLEVFVWHSYRQMDGVIVPFDPNWGGATVRPSCANAVGTIYMPINRPLGDEFTPGAIQSLAHEFMHTLQYAYAESDCDAYKWLREGTAKWAEDYVYHYADSEHPRAKDYLSKPNLRLDDPSTNTRYYGTWLLPYYLTHKLGQPDFVRLLWEKSETTANSFEAMYQSITEGIRDFFWAWYLPSLWNLAPYDAYYQKDDSLTDTVKAEDPNPIPVTLTNGIFTHPLGDDLKLGAARFTHFTFSDSSVRSFAVLNGIGKNLTKEDAVTWGNWDVTTGDQAYYGEELPADQAKGATLVLMLKAAGQDWQPFYLSYASLERESFAYCFDSQTKIDEMVVIQSNADWTHPDRVLSHQGDPSTVVATNIPCWKLQGTSKVTFFTAASEGQGVTEVYSANVTYGMPSAIPVPPVYGLNFFTYPEVSLTLLSADVNWTVSGSSGKCVYSGSGSYHVDEQPGAGSQYIYLFSGILAGGPSYRGYQGQGDQDESVQITYSITGEDCPGSATESAAWFLEIPITEDRAHIKVPPGGGALSGSYKRTVSWGDDYTLLEWNLNPQKK